MTGLSRIFVVDDSPKLFIRLLFTIFLVEDCCKRVSKCENQLLPSKKFRLDREFNFVDFDVKYHEDFFEVSDDNNLFVYLLKLLLSGL